MGSNTQDPYGPFPRMALNVRSFPFREVRPQEAPSPWGLSRNRVKNYSKGPCVTFLE